jgi:putative addiction module CopG family antidote
MDVHISENCDPFIRSQVQNGRYASEGAVLDEALRLLMQRDQELRHGTPVPAESAASDSEPVPAWKRVLENMQGIPNEVFDRIPADSSDQLDHYLYGTPKRPTR